MDVAYGDNLLRPRKLIIEVGKHDCCKYTTCSESGGVGYHPESALRTLEEWLKWLEKFSDELTGRQLREAREAATAPFVEPQSWTDFRYRYKETGDPWIREERQNS
jgi:hypothetical protein